MSQSQISNYIPKGIVELPNRNGISKDDCIALVSGNVAYFKTYKASIQDIEDKISGDFQDFSFENLVVNNLSVKNRLSSVYICCDTLCASNIYGTVNISGNSIDIDNIEDYRPLPLMDSGDSVYCFAVISSENGELVGGTKQLIPDSRMDCSNLSDRIDQVNDNLSNFFISEIQNLMDLIKNLQLSVGNLQSNSNESNNMNLAINPNNIIDITPQIPYTKNAGTTSEIDACSSFFVLPFGGTLGINHGHYYTIDSYDASNPITVEPYLFAKSGNKTQQLICDYAINNQNPTIFVKVQKGMAIASGNSIPTSGTNTQKIKNCILLYPELDDDLFSNDKTIEINKLLYDVNTSNNFKNDDRYGNIAYLSSYEWYKNETTDKQKYQVFYFDLQNVTNKDINNLTCSLFRCVDNSNAFNSHFLSGTNSPVAIDTKNKTSYGYVYKQDVFSIPKNSTMTRRYVMAPEDVILLYDKQTEYTGSGTKTSGLKTSKNTKNIFGLSVLVLSKGYVDINENSDYTMRVKLHGSIEPNLSSLQNIGSYWSKPNQLTGFDIIGPIGIVSGQTAEFSCVAEYSQQDSYVIKGTDPIAQNCTMSVSNGAVYQNNFIVSAGSIPCKIGISASYTDLGTTLTNEISVDIVSAAEYNYYLCGEENVLCGETSRYDICAIYNTTGEISDCTELNEFSCIANNLCATFLTDFDEYPKWTLCMLKDNETTTLSVLSNEVLLCEKDVKSYPPSQAYYPSRYMFGASNASEELEQPIKVNLSTNSGITTINLTDFTADWIEQNKNNVCSYSEISVIGSKEVPILSVGDSTFQDVSCVSEVHFPATVTTMGHSVFKNCKNLTKVNIPFVQETLSSVFEGCKELVDVQTPGTLRNIGDQFYMGCDNIKNIVVPKNVQTIGRDAFNGCLSVQQMVFLDNVDTVDGTAFDGCGSLTSFVISKNNKNFSESNGVLYSYDKSRLVTYPCPSEIVNVDYSVLSIDERAFKETGVNCVTFNEKLQGIGTSAFYGCSQLKQITFLPDNCPEILSDAFNTQIEDGGIVYLTPQNKDNYTYSSSAGLFPKSQLSNLPSQSVYTYKVLPLVMKLTLPKYKASNIYIGPFGFGTQEITETSCEVDWGDGSTTTLCCTQIDGVGTGKDTKFAKVTKDYSQTTKATNPIVTLKFVSSTNGDQELSILSVGNMVNGSGNQIQEIWLPQSIKTIGDTFAQNQTSLTAVHISECNSLTSIGKNALKGTNITELSCPNSIVQIGEGAMQNCYYLRNIDFSNITSLQSIPKNMCYGCYKANYSGSLSVNLDNKNITKIGESAFSGDKSLVQLTLPKELKDIEKQAFQNCIALTSELNLISSTYIGQSAFQGCTSITDLSIGCQNNASYKIDSSAFNGCTSISSITLNLNPDQLRDNNGSKYSSRIGNSAFANVGKTSIANLLASVGQTKYTYDMLTANGVNIIRVPEVTSYISYDSKNVPYVNAPFKGILPTPCNPNTPTTQIASNNIQWVYWKITP